MTISSGVARSTWRGQVSHAAITSRWVCTAAFGLPVVPEVKASRAISSALVGQGAARLLACRARASSEWSITMAASPVLNRRSGIVAVSGLSASAALSSSCSFTSHSAAAGRALSMMALSSVARSRGMVATAIRPLCTTASQANAMAMELPPRSSTRLPGCKPMPFSTWAMRLTSARACAYVRVRSSLRSSGRSAWPAAKARSNNHCTALSWPGNACNSGRS